jgi:hypothetical protein
VLFIGLIMILGAVVANGLVMARMNGSEADEQWDGISAEDIKFALNRER